jgi:hypothetical protein
MPVTNRSGGSVPTTWIAAGQRRVLMAVVGVVVLILAVIVAWRWRADRASVGTEAPAALTLGMCLNSVGWTDPSTGIRWWAGNWPVVEHNLETELRHLDDRNSIVGTATGTVRFDSYETATFTSTRGGTLPLPRTWPDQVHLTHCAGWPQIPEFPDPWRLGFNTTVLVRLTMPGDALGAPPRLVPGTVRALRGDEVVMEGRAEHGAVRLRIPQGPYTLTATGDTTACDAKAVVADTGAEADLICRPTGEQGSRPPS